MTKNICVLECWWREEEDSRRSEDGFMYNRGLKVHQPWKFKRSFSWTYGPCVPFLSSGNGPSWRTTSLLPQLPFANTPVP